MKPNGFTRLSGNLCSAQDLPIAKDTRLTGLLMPAMPLSLHPPFLLGLSGSGLEQSALLMGNHKIPPCAATTTQCHSPHLKKQQQCFPESQVSGIRTRATLSLWCKADILVCASSLLGLLNENINKAQTGKGEGGTQSLRPVISVLHNATSFCT